MSSRRVEQTFRGAVCVITGAGSGIGRALAQACAAAGACVVAADINESAVSDTASAIERAGGTALAKPLDVANPAEVESGIGQTVYRFGQIDVLTNNAGIAVAGEFFDLAWEHRRRVLDVNLMGAVYGARYAYDHMRPRGRGHIVNVSSMAGLTPYALHTPYAAAKSALIGFSATLRAEAAGTGVWVSVASPGPIDTPIFDTCTMVRLDRTIVRRNYPYKKRPPAVAARDILEGIACRREIIITPRSYYWLWLLYRLVPGWMPVMWASQARALRTARTP